MAPLGHRPTRGPTVLLRVDSPVTPAILGTVRPALRIRGLPDHGARARVKPVLGDIPPGEPAPSRAEAEPRHVRLRVRETATACNPGRSNVSDTTDRLFPTRIAFLQNRPLPNPVRRARTPCAGPWGQPVRHAIRRHVPRMYGRLPRRTATRPCRILLGPYVPALLAPHVRRTEQNVIISPEWPHVE